MIEKGEYLRLKLDNLLVKSGSREYTIPLSDIHTIIIENLDAVLTTRLLDACSANDIVVVTCDYKHQPTGIYNGLNTHSRASKIIRQQISWTDGFKDIIWSYIIKYKILNQYHILIINKHNNSKSRLLLEYVDEIQLGDKSNREGHAAKVYFNLLFCNDFSRKDENIINACLDYIYSVVRAFFTRLVVSYGYTGMIGLHHKSEYNNFNLVDDLMEPFRPYCDYYIINVLNIKDIDIFDLDLRMKLVDFLHYKIKYNNQNMMVMAAMEKYMHSFIRLCKSGDLNSFIMPLLSEIE